MAILLIALNDKPPTLARPNKRKRRGDVVGVFGNNHVFGRRESIIQWLSEGLPEEDYPAHFLIMKIPKTVAQVRNWMDHNDLDDEWAAENDTDYLTWSVDLTGLSHTQYKFNVTEAMWNNFKSRVRLKRTNETFEDRGA